MTDAEATIKHCLLSGHIDAIGKSPSQIKDILFNSLFHNTTIWAVKEYLQELEKTKTKNSRFKL
jgi:hypothetical protein